MFYAAQGGSTAIQLFEPPIVLILFRSWSRDSVRLTLKSNTKKAHLIVLNVRTVFKPELMLVAHIFCDNRTWNDEEPSELRVESNIDEAIPKFRSRNGFVFFCHNPIT